MVNFMKWFGINYFNLWVFVMLQGFLCSLIIFIKDPTPQTYLFICFYSGFCLYILANGRYTYFQDLT